MLHDNCESNCGVYKKLNCANDRVNVVLNISFENEDESATRLTKTSGNSLFIDDRRLMRYVVFEIIAFQHLLSDAFDAVSVCGAPFLLLERAASGLSRILHYSYRNSNLQ